MMRLQKTLWVCLALAMAMLTAGCGHPQPPLRSDATLGEKIERNMLNFREEFAIPAVQLGVIKNGQVVFAGSCGVRSLNTREAITNRSLFHLASLSKPLTAIAVLQLVEQGKVRLEGRVVDYLPYFRLKDDRFRDITIQQLLAHTSGLPDLEDYEWDRPKHDEGAAERMVRRLSDQELKTAPGERFRYSNIGYDILGDVIAKASGTSFEAYLKDHLFSPLDMADSTFLKAEVPQGLSVSPHRKGFSTLFMQRVEKVYPYHRAHAPSSTLHSNVGDMLKFCQAMLAGGSFRGKEILKPASHRLAWSEQADQGLRDGQKAEWMGKVGLGWFMGSYRGTRMISYVGADPGFRASMALLPEKGIAVICMGNSDTMRVGRLSRAALDLALE
jgi:CubicO group peptidase (beta-lactamase class C family)